MEALQEDNQDRHVRGGDVNSHRQCSFSEHGCLIMSINQNNLSEVERILGHSPKSVEGCNCMTERLGATKPLHLAASLGRIEICELLLHHVKKYKGIGASQPTLEEILNCGLNSLLFSTVCSTALDGGEKPIEN